MANGRPLLEELTASQCLRLIAAGGLGRVGINVDALPVILPVDFAVLADDVVVRTVPGIKLNAARAGVGATRQSADNYFLDEIEHYLYAGDTALHIAAAAYQPPTVRQLIAMGGDVGAMNRRGAQPLHYAADGVPGSPRWNPGAQAA